MPQRTIACRNLTATLRPLSATVRAQVRRAHAAGPGDTPEGSARHRLSLQGWRGHLALAVHDVMDELEWRSPFHPQVAALRAVYNVLLDDLGENEPHPAIRYSGTEAAEALIRQRRRTQRSPAALANLRPRRAA